MEEDTEMGGKHRQFLWGTPGLTAHHPPAVPRLVVPEMVLVDIFMASPSSPILVSYKEILNNFWEQK